MSKLSSKLSTQSEEFLEGENSYQALLDNLRETKARIETAGSDKALKKLKSRDKFPLSERLNQLIDPGSERLEIGELAAVGHYNDASPGAGIRTLVANISGQKCMIVANNPVIKAGTYFPLTVKKHLRAQEIAERNSLPCVYLVDSGGAYLKLQSEVFPDKNHFGRIFFNQARMSAQSIPQIAVVLGSCTAGGAYIPAMSDETIMVDGNSQVFLGGPPLVKAATGEEVSAEDLGGAKLHSKKSGLCDHLVSSESEALALTRKLMALRSQGQVSRLAPEQDACPPSYDPAEIGGLIGMTEGKAFPMKEILARLLDESRLYQFKENYAPELLCGFAHIEGYRVGIIANNGILFGESALKGTHFIQLCEKKGLPILFVQNIVGFMVGKKYEAGGIAKDGAKMVNAVSNAKVPKLSLIAGNSYGAGNYGMCGRAYDPEFLFSWPNSKIAVMGAAQAGSVLENISGPSKDVEKTKETFDKQSQALFASSMLWDDGIITPVDTRSTIRNALASISSPRLDETGSYGIFRM